MTRHLEDLPSIPIRGVLKLNGDVVLDDTGQPVYVAGRAYSRPSNCELIAVSMTTLDGEFELPKPLWAETNQIYCKALWGAAQSKENLAALSAAFDDWVKDNRSRAAGDYSDSFVNAGE